jgi:GDP-4-dehydro-6-deoxy-D-mannose reductase
MQTSNVSRLVDDAGARMKVLVTGADGFVGRHLVRNLVHAKHEVVAACRPGTPIPPEWGAEGGRRPLRTVDIELSSPQSVAGALSIEPDAVVHLAAVAYSLDAKANPAQAWDVNAGGTARLLIALAERRAGGSTDPLVLVASSAEVYREAEPRPRKETDATGPHSVYGASKLGAEAAAALAVAAWGLRLIVIRAFPATGPAQTNRLVPKWLKALRAGQTKIEGDGSIVRDYLDVRDMASGYTAMLTHGRAGETYNLASGRELRFGDLFVRLAGLLKVDARLVPPADPRREPPYLVGDSSKLQQHTGWKPTIPLERTLADMIDAQTD